MVLVRDGPGALPDVQSCWDVAAPRRPVHLTVHLWEPENIDPNPNLYPIKPDPKKQNPKPISHRTQIANLYPIKQNPKPISHRTQSQTHIP